MPDRSVFHSTFSEICSNYEPLLWQTRLYERLVQDDFPRSCTLPTGLGKTSVIPIWLIALAHIRRVRPGGRSSGFFIHDMHSRKESRSWQN